MYRAVDTEVSINIQRKFGEFKRFYTIFAKIFLGNLYEYLMQLNKAKYMITSIKI